MASAVASSVSSVRFRVVGKPFANNRLFLAQDDYEETLNRISCTTTYRDLYAGWKNRIPKILAPHPLYPRLPRREARCRQIVPGRLCDVTLTYYIERGDSDDPDDEEDPDTDPGDSPPTAGLVLPQEEETETASSIEVPIEAAPYFASVSYAEREAIDKALGQTHEAPTGISEKGLELYHMKLSGQTSFVVGSVLKNTTTYYWQRPASVSSAVGKLDGPNWLVVSGERSKQGPFWRKTISKLYSKTPWPPHIYGGGS